MYNFFFIIILAILTLWFDSDFAYKPIVYR